LKSLAHRRDEAVRRRHDECESLSFFALVFVLVRLERLDSRLCVHPPVLKRLTGFWIIAVIAGIWMAIRFGDWGCRGAMLGICNMRDTKDGSVSMAGLRSGTLGHCHASIAARKRATVAQRDASGPVISRLGPAKRPRARLLATMH
jgi:hypothetical protein